MKIEEAIKSLHSLKAGCSGKELDPEREAIQLGIEALKRIYDRRHHIYTPEQKLLEGETKD